MVCYFTEGVRWLTQSVLMTSNNTVEVSTSRIYKWDLFFHWAVSRKLLQDRTPLLLSSLILQADTQVRFVRHTHVVRHVDNNLVYLCYSRIRRATAHLNSHNKSISVQRQTCKDCFFWYCFPGIEFVWKALPLTISSGSCHDATPFTYFLNVNFI